MTRVTLAHVLAVGALALGCTRVTLQVGSDRDSGIVPEDAAVDPLHVQSIALGADHACAVLTDGRVACWGADDLGQLSLDRELFLGERCGERFCATRPTPSEHLANAVEVVGGDAFACARTALGEVRCWGSNRVGELGAGLPGDSERHPVPREVARDVLELAAGRHHACLRDAAGLVRCWGLGAQGQLGAAPRESCPVPAGLEAELGVDDGTASVPCATRPIAIEGLGAVDRIAAGDHHTCAIQAGRAICWGRDHRGQLGDGSPDPGRASPGAVEAPSGVVALSLGGDASLALDAAGGALAWGDASRGQLWLSPAESASCDGVPCAPVPRASDRALAAIALGRAHGCGIDVGGTALCWGLAGEGRLGSATAAPDTCGSEPCALAPRRVDGLPTGVRSIAVGDAHACALVFASDASASVRCWGRNDVGQLGAGGFGPEEPSPIDVLGTR